MSYLGYLPQESQVMNIEVIGNSVANKSLRLRLVQSHFYELSFSLEAHTRGHCEWYLHRHCVCPKWVLVMAGPPPRPWTQTFVRRTTCWPGGSFCFVFLFLLKICLPIIGRKRRDFLPHALAWHWTSITPNNSHLFPVSLKQNSSSQRASHSSFSILFLGCPQPSSISPIAPWVPLTCLLDPSLAEGLRGTP